MPRLISFISPSSIFVTFAISTLLSVFIVKVSSITLSFIFLVFSPKQITFGSFCEQQTAYLLWAMTLSKTHFCLVSKISASSLLNSISQLTEVRQPELSLAGSNLQCLFAIFKIVSLSIFCHFLICYLRCQVPAASSYPRFFAGQLWRYLEPLCRHHFFF